MTKVFQVQPPTVATVKEHCHLVIETSVGTDYYLKQNKMLGSLNLKLTLFLVDPLHMTSHPQTTPSLRSMKIYHWLRVVRCAYARDHSHCLTPSMATNARGIYGSLLLTSNTAISVYTWSAILRVKLLKRWCVSGCTPLVKHGVHCIIETPREPVTPRLTRFIE